MKLQQLKLNNLYEEIGEEEEEEFIWEDEVVWIGIKKLRVSS